MSQGIKDHFVPCGYLRHFATEDSQAKNSDYRKWRVHAYNKIKDEEISVPVSVDSVAYSKYFEHYEGDENLNSEVRERIRQVEGGFFPIQEKIVKSQSLDSLLREDFLTLFEFIALQRERTLARRNLYKSKFKSNLDVDEDGKIEFSKHRREMIQKQFEDKVLLTEQQFEKLVEDGTEEQIRQFFIERKIDMKKINLDQFDLKSYDGKRELLERVKSSISRYLEEASSGRLYSRLAENVHGIASDSRKLQNYHLENLFSRVDEFAEQLKSCGWVLWLNKTSQPFWTSDNPAVHCFIPPKMENIPESVENLLNQTGLVGLLLESSSIVNLDGTANSELCLIFPIAPNLLLQVCAYNPSAGFRLLQNEIKDELNVHQTNFWQFATTSRNLYCNEKKFEQTAQMQTELQKLFQDFFNFPQNLDQALEPFFEK